MSASILVIVKQVFATTGHSYRRFGNAAV